MSWLITYTLFRKSSLRSYTWMWLSCQKHCNNQLLLLLLLLWENQYRNCSFTDQLYPKSSLNFTFDTFDDTIEIVPVIEEHHFQYRYCHVLCIRFTFGISIEWSVFAFNNSLLYHFCQALKKLKILMRVLRVFRHKYCIKFF